MELYDVTIRIADYAPVKAVIDAASEVCESEGSVPWEQTEKIASLREALSQLPRIDEGEGWEG